MKRVFFPVLIFLMVGVAAVLETRQPVSAQTKVPQLPVPLVPFPLIPFPQTPVPRKPDAALKVSVSPHLTYLYTGERLNLTLKITNASAAVQTFQAMSCSWPDESHSSGARLSGPDFACAANAPITITLAPHASYEKTLLMSVGAMPKGKVAFQMGFTPCGASGGGATYWSDKIPVQVN